MRNTARAQFVEIAIPAFSEFVSHYVSPQIGLRYDTRRAAAVADALLNLSDYVHVEKANDPSFHAWKTKKTYREAHLWKLDQNYEITCDLANAWKHRRLTRDKSTFSSLEDVREYVAVCRFRDSDGVYYRSRKLVAVTLKDGREFDLRPILTSAMVTLGQELHRLSLIPKVPHLEQFSNFVPRADPAPKMRILGKKDEFLEIGTKHFDYDETSGQLVTAAPGTGFNYSIEYEFVITDSLFDA